MNESRKMRTKKIIGVCGGADISDEIYQIAMDLGREIAKANYIVVCGGKGGAMEAVCKGAKEYGCITIGILPSKDKGEANPFIDIIIPTGLGELRNNLIINTADIIITINGGAGTLNEITLAWKAKKTIIALVNTGGWSQKLGNSKIDDTRSDPIISASTVSEAIDICQKL